MAKRLVDIDDETLKKAQAVLGTSTMKETVNEALQEVVRAALRREHVLRLAQLQGLDLDKPEVMRKAWREG